MIAFVRFLCQRRWSGRNIPINVLDDLPGLPSVILFRSINFIPVPADDDSIDLIFITDAITVLAVYSPPMFIIELLRILL